MPNPPSKSAKRKMITPFPSSRRAAVCLTTLACLAGLAAFSPARAEVPSNQTNSVVPNDPFGITLTGYNTTEPQYDIGLIQSGLSPVFNSGTPQTFANSALGGQTLTVTTTQTGTATNFVDTITITVPTNFVPAGTVDNNNMIINGIVFSIGTLYGGTSTLDFNTSLVGARYSGSAQGTMLVNTSLAGVQNPQVTNNNMSLSNQEGIYSFQANGTTPRDISAFGINQFQFTIAVPEPSTYATVLLGVAGLCWLTVARRRARA